MSKFIPILLACLFTSVIQAATITFDDVPTGIDFGGLDTPQGYTFYNFPGLTTSALHFVEQRAAPNDNYLDYVVSGITMRSSDNSPFSLQALDVLFIDTNAPNFGGGGSGDASSNDVLIRATDSFGNLIAEIASPYADGFGWRTLTFGSEWTGITELELGWSASEPEGWYGGYDNIVVTGVVPVPAAAWLFGSALAGLGWMRCKRAAWFKSR